MGTDSSGVKANGNGDPYVHAPDVRSETGNMGGMPSTRADSKETKPTPSHSTRRDDPDPYGVA